MRGPAISILWLLAALFLVAWTEGTIVTWTDGVQYRIGRSVGSGGSGEAYLAERVGGPPGQPPIVLKKVTTHVAHVESGHNLLARLGTGSSPHILPTSHAWIGEGPGRQLVVRSDFGGTDLSRFVGLPADATPAQLEARLRGLFNASGQMMAALRDLHARGLIHNDVKPSNFFVDGGLPLENGPGGTVRIADFDAVTRPGQPTEMHSVFFMSPERMRDYSSTSAGSDHFALGCSMYEMVFGTTPLVDFLAREHGQTGLSGIGLGVRLVDIYGHQKDMTHDQFMTFIRARFAELARDPRMTAAARETLTRMESAIVALLARDPAQRQRGAESLGVRMPSALELGMQACMRGLRHYWPFRRR